MVLTSCECGKISQEAPGLCRNCGMFADTDIVFRIPQDALDSYCDEYLLGNMPLIKQFMKIKELNESRGIFMR